MIKKANKCIEWGDGGVGELINTTINRGIILVGMIGSDGQLICIFGSTPTIDVDPYGRIWYTTIHRMKTGYRHITRGYPRPSFLRY